MPNNPMEPYPGVVMTKHFVERIVQRFKPNDARDIVQEVNRRACMLVYELTLKPDAHKTLTVGDIRVGVKLHVGNDYPKIYITTAYLLYES